MLGRTRPSGEAPYGMAHVREIAGTFFRRSDYELTAMILFELPPPS